ncbi:hypothetical protein KY284_023822 [Solanum tuberosum]|nr:hypothetical protein KY284_023822 [Solanum tuberosum]
MAKVRGGIVKQSVPKPSKNKKIKAEEVSRSSTKKKVVVEEPKSNSNSEMMVGIDNYEDSSAQATDDVESSEQNTESGDEEISKYSRDTGGEDDDPLSLPTSARVISAYPRDAKMKKVLQKGEKFYYKVTKNKNISGTKLLCLIKDTRLNKEQKLKCSLVWLVHSMLLAHDRSKIVDSNHIKMVDDLDFFKSYPWGKECFDLTLKYLKKQSEVYKERGNASYALYGFPWAFLIWIYEVFPHLGNYAKKSLDSPLPIPHLLRWHTKKSDNIVEGDPFEYKGKSTKVVHPYLVPTVRETKQNYMATLKPYTDEANLKGVTVLTSAVENEKDEILGENNSNQPCENSVSSEQNNKDDNLCERVASLELSMMEVVAFIRDEKLRRAQKSKKNEEVNEDYTTPIVDKNGATVDVDEILPLAIVDEDLVAVDEYFAEEVNKQKEEKMAEKDEEREEEKLEENEEEIEEKLEEKKQEEKEEERIEENKKEEKEEEQIKEKEEEQKEEEKIE